MIRTSMAKRQPDRQGNECEQDEAQEDREQRIRHDKIWGAHERLAIRRP